MSSPDPSSVSDEELRKLLKPKISVEDALDVLKKSYSASPSKEGEADATVFEVVKELDSYDDVNYLVRRRAGSEATMFLLKVHNGVESGDLLRAMKASEGDYYRPGCMDSAIHLQNAMMEVLNSNGIPTSLPQPVLHPGPVLADLVAQKSSQIEQRQQRVVAAHILPVVSAEHSPCPLVVRLLGFVPGCPMSDVKSLPIEVLVDCGRFLGKVDRTLDYIQRVQQVATNKSSAGDGNKQGDQNVCNDSSKRKSQKGVALNEATERVLKRLDVSIMKPAKRYHIWDGKNVADVRKYVECIPDAGRREIVSSILDAFQREIVDTGVRDQFRVGLNHGDYNDANIILNQADASELTLQVSGVIDFGDSVESWRVLDCSVAMAYGMLSSYGKDKDCSLAAAAAVLRGYHSVYPLLPVEREHLVLLVACRLATSVTLGAYSYQQNPGNQYLLLHAEPAWKALGLVWDTDEGRRKPLHNAVNLFFNQACSFKGPQTVESGPQSSGNDAIPCSDLMIPDPCVADPFQSFRASPNVEAVEDDDQQSSARKKQKTENDSGLPVIAFVTGNAKKLEEVRRILGVESDPESSQARARKTGPNSTAVINASSKQTSTPSSFRLINVKLDLPELQGDPNTIAKEKCILASQKVRGAVITEDTSLCFNALNGLPGPYIKWFLESCGHEGLNRMIGGYDDKNGYAQTVVSYCPGPGREPVIFNGRTEGKIVMPRGKLDFGWDPVFEPNEGNGKTYAEMSKEEKDSISHRSRAFAKLREHFSTSPTHLP